MFSFEFTVRINLFKFISDRNNIDKNNINALREIRRGDMRFEICFMKRKISTNQQEFGLLIGLTYPKDVKLLLRDSREETISYMG